MVRPFPRTTGRAPAHRRSLTAAVLTGALLGSAFLPGAAAEDLDDKRDQVEKKIDQADEHLDESSAELTAATNALLQAQADLAAAREHLAQTRGELAAAEALDLEMQEKLELAIQRLETAREELAAGRADVAAQEEELRRMVVAAYQQGDPALVGLSMVFTTQDPAQLVGKMNASSTVVNIESAVLERLEASKVLLTVREDEIEAAKKEVADRRREAAENLVLKQALEVQASEAEQSVEEKVGLRRDARQTALEAKQDDLAALQRLEAERDRIEELIRRRASRTNVTRIVNGGGVLDFPVAGSITSPFGWRTHPIWGYQSLHDGVDFGAGCGTPIRAVASGVVISQYYQSAWGNRVIIDHGVQRGVGVATISNHLSRYAVSQGQRVSRGQVIGYVGDTGWSTGCHLHFTVMQNGVPVDPMSWF